MLKTPSVVPQDHEEKLINELKSAAEGWKWKLNLPEKPNYDNVYFYKKSKKIFNAPCYDLDFDRPPENYKGEFLQVNNELHQTEFKLRNAQDEAKKKKQNLAKEWKEIEAKETKLRENFIQFNRFLKRNIIKRTKAEEKYHEMKALKTDCTKKIAHMREESGDIKEFVDKLKNRVLLHEIYEKYLNTVVMTGNFRTIHEIIDRYVQLKETKQTVGNLMDETSEKFHHQRMLYVQMVEISQLKFLSLSNKLSEMRRKYDDAKSKTSSWEVVLQDICNKYEAAAQNISWSRMALRHMFDMAFCRIYRRRKRLVKTKKDDLGKMLGINETLRALEGIEMQLRKLQDQKDVGTSMDPVRDGYELKQEGSWKISGFIVPGIVKKWRFKRGEYLHTMDGLVDLVGYLKSAARNEILEDPCPIRLEQEKWKLAKVKNFEDRYKKALLAIRQEELDEKNPDLTSRGLGIIKEDAKSRTAPKPRRSKWAAAAVAQENARDVSFDAHLATPTSSAHVMASALSDSALTIIEDVDNFSSATSRTNRKMQMKRIIDKKFAALLDFRPTRDISCKDKEKQSVTLPSILSGYQTNDRDFLARKKQERSDSLHPYGDRKESSTIAPGRRRKTFTNIAKLPSIIRNT